MIQKNKIYQFIIILSLFCTTLSCGGNYIPKPHGYLRFDMPEKQYHLFDTTFPYRFEYPVYGEISKLDNANHPYWINIVIPEYKATIYLSYNALKNNLPELLEDTYQLVYKHTIKADAITEQPFVNPDKKVYGFLYDLGGNTATAVQFYVTDSVKNFIRGSLYFYSEPNKDSLAPLISYFREDIQYIMETMEWK